MALPALPRRTSSVSRRSSTHLTSPEEIGMPQRLPSQPVRGASEEALINQFEAEEERLVLLLTRKLEKLRQDKAASENEMEAESENMVLRLSKQLSALLQPSDQNLSEKVSRLEHQLEQATQTADLYRSELIELRKRCGMDISDLVGVRSRSEASAGSSLPISGASSLGMNGGGETETAETTPCGSYEQGPPPPSLANSFADQIGFWPQSNRRIAEVGTLERRGRPRQISTGSKQEEEEVDGHLGNMSLPRSPV